ncbi:phage portal protein [Mycobacterium sp. PDNC021]|uniref:phage portal protein n=1 Tax=Mycobacterium sp. PDNC021 TaxID=3391399 RepID=UPI003AAD154C
MDDQLLVDLLQTLDAPQAEFARLNRYYAGTQDLAFLAPESKKALGDRFSRMATNLPRLAVTSLAERLRVNGFDGPGDVWADWTANDLDQYSDLAHREALTLGSSYAVVWADAGGSPRVSIESARQVAVLADPGSRQITSAVKRWHTRTTTEAALYLPDVVYRLRADTPGAQSTGFYVVDELENPLGVVPVVQLRNAERVPVGWNTYPDRLLEFGHSEIADLVPLVDGINKLLADMLVAAEYTARPRRYATGIELVSMPVLDADGNPVLDGNGKPVMEVQPPIQESWRMMWSEKPEAKFGTLPGASLDGYENAVNVLLGQVMAVSALPAHYVGIFTDNPASADAIRSSEASLTARAEARQNAFGKGWEQVANLMTAIRTGGIPDEMECRVKWCDPATRSDAADADAVTKLFQAGIISRAESLRRLGYTEDQIQLVSTEKMDETLDESTAKDPFRGAVAQAAADHYKSLKGEIQNDGQRAA